VLILAVALDVIGMQIKQNGQYHCLFITCTPKASPAIIGNQEEQYTEPIRKKEKVKHRFCFVQEQREEKGE
jgi:hypothetical protein